MPVYVGALVGDSISEGAAGAVGEIYGGTGGYVELVAEHLAQLKTLGPRLGPGFRAVSSSIVVTGPEWRFTGTFNDVLSTDAFDKATYGLAKWANGPANIQTYSMPFRWHKPVGYGITYVDKTGGGDWQYRVNGGPWVNMGQTLLHDNAVCAFYVTAPQDEPMECGVSTTNGDVCGGRFTVEFRASSDDTTGVDMLVIGIEPFWIDPRFGATGFILDNYAKAARDLRTIIQTTSGDRMAVLKPVRVDPVHGGGMISKVPNVFALMEHLNDVKDVNDLVQWDLDLRAFASAFSCPVGFISPYEDIGPLYPYNTQAAYRSVTKSTGAAIGAQVFDLFDAWTSNGWGTGAPGTQYAAIVAYGFILPDTLHPTQLANLDMAARVVGWIKAKFFRGKQLGGARMAMTSGTSTTNDPIDLEAGIPPLTPSDLNDLATFSRGRAFPAVASASATGGLDVFSRGAPATFLAPAAAYIATFTDGVGLTDAAARVVAISRVINNPMGLTDGILTGKLVVKTDPLGLTDTRTRVSAVSRIISDSLGLLDSVVPPSSNKSVTINDALGISDVGALTGADVNDLAYFNRGRAFYAVNSKSSARGLDVFSRGVPLPLMTAPRVSAPLRTVGYQRLRTDAEGMTDALTQAKVGIFTNPLGMTDVVVATLGAQRAIADAIGLQDSGIAVITSADPIALSDAVAITRGKNVVDVEPLSDVMLITRGKTRTDPLGLTDAVVVTPGHFATPSNPLGLTDAVVRIVARTLTNPLGLSDTMTTNAGPSPILTNPLGLTDVVAVTSTIGRLIADVEGLGDAVQASGPSGFSLTLTDLEGLSDAIARVVVGNRVTSDALGLTDAVVRLVDRFRTRTDPEALTDTVTVAHGWVAQPTTDPVGIVDVVIRFVPAFRSLADPIGLTDVMTITTPGVRFIDNPLGLTDGIILKGSAVVGPPVNWRWRVGKTVSRWRVGETSTP